MYNYEEMNVMYHTQFLDSFNFGFNYWIDNNDVYWFSYDDICENLEFSSKKSKYYFAHSIDDCDKCTIYVLNFRNKFNEEYKATKDFITYNAMMNLIDRNNRRNNSFVKVVHSLYTRIESHYNYDEDEKINKLAYELNENKNNRNYEDMFINIHELYHTETCRDVLDKAGVIDKDVEELLDLIRTDIVYFNNLNEIEMTLINDEEDFAQVTFTKNSKESTCPSWLRDIVK